jgi:hypothetical protein
MPKNQGKKRNKKGTRRGDESSDDDTDVSSAEQLAAEPSAGRSKGKSKTNKSTRPEFRFGDVDPRRIRFAHARIKPMFSGCGRTLDQTLMELREGTTSIASIPKITIMVGPVDEETGEPWFFSLNNRRLYVFKQLCEEGCLEAVPVRIRDMKPHEQERYTVDNCGLNAKFLFRLDADVPCVSDLPADTSTVSGDDATERLGDQGIKPTERL